MNTAKPLIACAWWLALIVLVGATFGAGWAWLPFAAFTIQVGASNK